MDVANKEFVIAGSLEELKAKGRLVLHGGHRPILVVYDRGRVFALDNRCPHMGFPLERGSVEDGILTCHWHHARFDLESGCTFDLWADDVPIFPVELRNGEVWVKTTLGHADPAAHWHQRLADGLAHDLGLVIAKAVHGQLAADVPRVDIVRQVALFGAQNRDGWGVGLTILTALANLLPVVPEEEAYLALFHGARHVAADCDGQAPRRELAARLLLARMSSTSKVMGSVSVRISRMKLMIARRPVLWPIQGRTPSSPWISNTTSASNRAAISVGLRPSPIPSSNFSAIAMLC
jgi:nitrite reductase/ring-hydroxylating ferredoxin subunit